MADTEKTDSDLFTPQEREYFESRGEKPIVAETAPEPAPPEKPEPTEPIEPSEPPKEAAEGEEKETPKEERKVDYGALREERERRKAAEDKAREMELLNARMEERFKAWQDNTRPPPKAPVRPPRADEDIFGAVNYLQRTQEQQAKELETYKKREAEAAQMQQLANHAARSVEEFKKTTPDYPNAFAYLQDSRRKELAVWGMDEVGIANQLETETRQLIARAVQARRSPAEMAYTLAKERGYSAKQAPATADPVDQLDRIERGQQQNRSMSGTGGNGRAGGEITLADLVRMPENEFVAFKNKYPARFRRLKGADH
jgi:hypothetical protein